MTQEHHEAVTWKVLFPAGSNEARVIEALIKEHDDLAKELSSLRAQPPRAPVVSESATQAAKDWLNDERRSFDRPLESDVESLSATLEAFRASGTGLGDVSWFPSNSPWVSKPLSLSDAELRQFMEAERDPKSTYDRDCISRLLATIYERDAASGAELRTAVDPAPTTTELRKGERWTIQL